MVDRRLSLPARLREVTVVHNETENYFDLSLDFYSCANNFKMLEVYNAPATGSTGRML